MELEFRIDDEIADVKFGRPHVFILGAGASLAAFPDGDINGLRLPLMHNFTEILGLDNDLKKYNINFEGENFEEIYSFLYGQDEYKDIIGIIEDKTFKYFSQMKLPAVPTMYDHLVLSLRKKDLVATFNWDPFLYLACFRNHRYVELPQIVYLHGNVAIGYCLEHRTKGMVGYNCSVCQKPYEPSRLLFPVSKKDYAKDSFILAEWKTLKSYLKSACMVTVFGYSAPKKDIEAVSLMKEAWGDVNSRELEEIEIIDIKDQDELRETWDDFIHTHHYTTCNDFYDSFVAKHPRRTCEAMWNQLMECKFISDNNLPKGISFDELYGWLQPLLNFEKNKANKR
jgi:hypothetical protein